MMNARGFTLVEVLVVLVILGLTVTFTTLGFQRLESDRLQKQAGYLSAWLQDLNDSSVLDGAVYGAWLNRESNRLESGYYFDNRWWPITGDGALSEALADDQTLYLETDEGWRPARHISGSGEDQKKAPEILFMPTGLTLPEKFQLRTNDNRVATIERDENGLYTWSVVQ